MDMVKIANISMGYHNKDLIKLLRERGTIINECQFEKLKKMEDKIDAEIKKDQAGENNFTKPVTAFVTFET